MTEEVQADAEIETETVTEDSNDTNEEVESDDVETGEDLEGDEPETKEIDYKVEHEKAQKRLEKEQQKINRQRKALSENYRKIQELNEQLAKVQQEQVEKEPSVNDFDTYEEYDKARIEYIKKQASKEASANLIKQQQQRMLQQQQAEQQQNFLKAEAAYRNENPQYDAAKNTIDLFMQSSQRNAQVDNMIYEQANEGNGLPELINYFGENDGERLDEFERISNLTPRAAAIEIYKIEQMLKTKPTHKKAKPLPKPAEPIKGNSSTRKPLAKMSYEELKKTIYKE